MAIVVANMIGTGVFTSLGFQVDGFEDIGLPSGFTFLMFWILGGIFALCGALSYAELGASMPRSGGEFHYLSQIYHPAVGFLSGWISATVGFAAPIALAAMALGKYLSSVTGAETAEGFAGIIFNPTVIAVAVIVLVTIVHLRNLKLGSVFQNVFTAIKVLLIMTLILAGFLFSEPSGISFSPGPVDMDAMMSAPFAIGLVFVMYSYSGWNASTYIASEVRNPAKNLPRSLFIGTALVMALYILINAMFLMTTPAEKFVVTNENGEQQGVLEIGYVVAGHIFGAEGGKIFGLLISLALISSISSMVWAGPRVTQVIGEDIPFFAALARKNKDGIPQIAMLLQLAIALGLAISSTFETVISYTIFTLILSSFATVTGVYVLRIRRPDLPRPYKTWGYPLTPAIFIAISLWMLIYLGVFKWQESLGGLVTILAGLLIYLLTSGMKPNGGSGSVTPEKETVGSNSIET